MKDRSPMIMLDLFSGLGGASRAMKERGWEVYTLDIEPSFNADFKMAIQDFSWNGLPLALIWASPPCEEFSRESMPWCKTGKAPSMELVEEILRIIKETCPRYWIIENTKGAVPWFKSLLGPPQWVSNPIYLWGHFPPLPKLKLRMNKEKFSSTQAAKRAYIPYELSLALAISIEGAFNFIGRPGGKAK